MSCVCVCVCFGFLGDFLSLTGEVMQRGVSATADILNGLLNGLQLPRGSLVTVVDLFPNRFLV